MSRHRDQRSLKRRKLDKEKSGDIILIVCEGLKTEPKYFEGLCERWKLSAANIEVEGKGGAPISVVDHALALRKKRKRNRNAVEYDQVWCVFDHEGKNKHPTLDDALVKAKANGLKVALSVPSFEFWYLLHFHYTTGFFEDSDAVESALKAYIEDYTKGKAPLSKLLPNLKKALDNARKIRKYNETSGARNPSTDVDIVVKKLQSLRSPGSVD